jgi:hypothetical protein
MESDTVEKIREKFRTLEPEDQKKVLEFVERLSVETAQGDASMKERTDGLHVDEHDARASDR